ncbi:trypsin-1-like [Eupeodes corollae]|uniref:trypsin-1-like n=1 Tax=Eupeodes corollae TaxID=290404 RepID=UPI002493C2F8|nr:trypsin-1-like [Eupeodes corollae]
MEAFLTLGVYFVLLFKLVNCSNVSLEGRIVGGKEINISMCPYQVSVRYSDSHICGGTIISNDTILTAGHCTDGQTAESLSIRHGSSYADYGIKHQVTQIIQHPDFYADYYENDAALLKITPPIKFTRSSQPAKLATRRSPDNAEAIICGWGVHQEYADTTDLGKKSLRAVTLRVVNRRACQLAYRNFRNDENQMCAAARNKDNCQGDSGGGLLAKSRREMIGISSWGDGCAKEGKPGVYTSVPGILPFIRKNL